MLYLNVLQFRSTNSNRVTPSLGWSAMPAAQCCISIASHTFAGGSSGCILHDYSLPQFGVKTCQQCVIDFKLCPFYQIHMSSFLLYSLAQGAISSNSDSVLEIPTRSFIFLRLSKEFSLRLLIFMFSVVQRRLLFDDFNTCCKRLP